MTIRGVTDGEKWDKFCAELKYDVRLEVMKSAVTYFKEAAKVALRVDSAIWVSFQGHSQRTGASAGYDALTPMEIGNVEKSRGRRRNDPAVKQTTEKPIVSSVRRWDVAPANIFKSYM